MDRHFILPITFAAAFHVGLLFGFRGHSVEQPASVTRILQTFPDPLPITIIPPEPDPDATVAPKGEPQPASPTLPDRPEAARPEDFIIDVPQHPVTTIPDVNVISVGGVGLPEGVGVVGPILSRVGDLDNPPHARFQAAPIYPQQAKSGGLGGQVTVEFMVDESGYVHEPRVTHSTDGIFEEPALRAVARWRFEPGKRGGQIVRFKMAVPIVFSLQDN